MNYFQKSLGAKTLDVDSVDNLTLCPDNLINETKLKSQNFGQIRSFTILFFFLFFLKFVRYRSFSKFLKTWNF